MNYENKKINWALFVSGWGRSAKICIDLLESGKLKNSLVQTIVTTGQETPLLEIAKKKQIKTIEDDPFDFVNFNEYQTNLANKLLDGGIDYIFLLNYKYRVRKPLLEAFPNRIVNIHPSLLPSFKNTASAIQDAMQYGVKISGITTHLIDGQIDEGVILCQKAIVFKEQDNFESLDAKFLDTGKRILLQTFNLINNNHRPGSYLKEYLKP